MARNRATAPPVDGPVNFRDIGGYSTATGRSVRWGRVFRSDSLETLTPLDLARIDDLGIRLVCDLRRDQERIAGPSKVEGYGQVRIEHLPIGGIAAETGTWRVACFAARSPRSAQR